MNFEKVVFGFFIVLALTLNFGFFIGDIDNPDHHNVMELGAALAVSLIATIIKFGDRSQMGAILLATSLVADLQLLVAAFVWAWAANPDPTHHRRQRYCSGSLWLPDRLHVQPRRKLGDLLGQG